MNIRRILIYLALSLVGVALWNAWMRDYPPASIKPAETTQQSTTTPPTAQSPTEFTPTPYTPGAASTTTQSTQTASVISAPSKNLIRVQTNVFDIAIDPVGGQIVSAKLPKYPVATNQKETPIQILTSDPAEVYVIQTGLMTAGKTQKINFTAEKNSYVLAEGRNDLTVSLKGKTAEGLEVIKTFTFTRDLYSIKTDFQLKNTSSKNWNGNIFQQIIRRNVPPKEGFRAQSYNEASYSSPEEPYKKLSFKTLDERELNQDIQSGWIAMQQQYFLTALIPDAKTTNRYYSHTNYDPVSSGKNNIYIVGYISPSLSLAPGAVQTHSSTIYVGPELAHQLKPLAKGLDLTIDYGFLWPISSLLFWIMERIHAFVGNWGVTIILVTLLIKLIFYPLSDKSYKSMVKMRDLQPKIQTLKERHGDDKAAFSKSIMELYKTEKVNPMGGCLPMLIQIPVFIALYYVLIESVELRQAPFMLWIQDLSAKDPYYILPVLMGISMFIQQKLSPPPPDPTQAKMMMLLPVVFTVFLISFPSGLVLYWLTNNILSILQQWYVMKYYHPRLKTASKKKKVKATS